MSLVSMKHCTARNPQPKNSQLSFVNAWLPNKTIADSCKTFDSSKHQKTAIEMHGPLNTGHSSLLIITNLDFKNYWLSERAPHHCQTRNDFHHCSPHHYNCSNGLLLFPGVQYPYHSVLSFTLRAVPSHLASQETL